MSKENPFAGDATKRWLQEQGRGTFYIWEEPAAKVPVVKGKTAEPSPKEQTISPVPSLG